MSTPHRKRVRSYNVPGHAHELTFSCFRRLPLLSCDRTRRSGERNVPIRMDELPCLWT